MISSPFSSFHIVFCIDERYFRSMGATMLSIVDNNPNLHITFHVLTPSASDIQRARLLELDQSCHTQTHIHLIEPDIFTAFSHFTQATYYSPAIFTRLIIPDLLKEHTDRVLYLDADILCVGSLTPLIHLPMEDVLAYVVADAPITTKRAVKRLKLPHPTYFNSGMLYINIPQWTHEKITEKTIDALSQTKEPFRFPDQDALNIALNGRAHYIEKRWNYLYGLIGDLEKGCYHLHDINDATLIHFAGAVKPWANWSGHEACQLFQRYLSRSPWRNEPLDMTPQNHKEMRMHARFLFRQGKIGQSMLWFYRYLRTRAHHS